MVPGDWTTGVISGSKRDHVVYAMDFFSYEKPYSSGHSEEG